MTLFLLQLPKFPFWGPFATIDEQLQYYQVARNYHEYGFLRNAFLPDLSTGSSPSQHPYLYNHQPPGPQLLIGILIRMFGENFILIRLIFAAVFVSGVLCFLAFAKLLAREGVYGAEWALLLIRPGVVMHAIDHPGYSAFPLFAFLPIVVLDRCRTTGNSAWLAAAAVLVFVGSNYLMYSLLFMVFVFWVLGALLKIVEIRRLHLLVLASAAVLGVGAHLLQTVIVVGWSVFAKELLLTISNRMFGTPSREELSAFYRSIGFVLYGEHVFSLTRLGTAIGAAFSFPGRAACVVVLVAVAALAAVRHITWESSEARIAIGSEIGEMARRLAKLAVWSGVAILTPFVMFPAFSADYPLHGMNEFLLGILVVGALGAVAQADHGPWRDGTRRGLMYLFIAGYMVWAMTVQIGTMSGVAWRVWRWTTGPSIEGAFSKLAEEFRGKVVMTNVDPAVAGFFTRESALGGCQIDSVTEAGVVPERCRVHFIHGFPGHVTVTPAAFVWVGSGNSFCRPTEQCLRPSDLERIFRERFSTPLVRIFDVHRGF